MTPLHSRDRQHLALRVRTALEAQQGDYPTLQQVAARLCVSARTLKRRLKQIGSSYRQLLDAVRLVHAMELLQRTGLSLEAIALRLGYSSSANFSRAFRRWTGMPPGHFRNRAPVLRVDSDKREQGQAIAA
ncbi:AraC family transcriptional regulator [Solimonas sp. K1W22B-7]|uniref:helix-turn-helix transcriptional regulator n=1 Tax=Solimonas sp. K1W22B-7 TaxID=2303331 RepID=UPI000E334243|nr:helix-turn-helix transcriptional regulator [Solimonas sp. K1W22B-7]AXQ30642.1 AraC family transcriptional regulator [Solimonas sp. K1W22B-7]